MTQMAELPLTDAEVAQLTAEALRPDDTPDSFTLGDKTFPLKLHPSNVERKVVKLIGPMFAKIAALDSADVEGFLALSDEAFDVLPEAISLITEGALTAQAIGDTYSITEQIQVGKLQLAKYGLQDRLGKLSGLLGR